MIHQILTAVCAFRIYRGPDQAPWINNGLNQGTNRPQTVKECVATAITEGKVLADGPVKCFT